MKLISASYGLPICWKNVMHQMFRFIKPTGLVIPQTQNLNRIFGDPCNGKRKILRLIISKENNQYEIDLVEDHSRLTETFDTRLFNFEQHAKLISAYTSSVPNTIAIPSPPSSQLQVKTASAKKIRLLLIDCLFPTTHGQWRTVEINYLISHASYETDILLSPFSIHTVLGLKETLDSIFETYFSLYKHLDDYNIFIFDKQFNALNKYNKNGFNGILYNDVAKGSFLLSRATTLDWKSYDVAYSIFLGVQMCNMALTEQLLWPSVCKVYAGGGFDLHNKCKMSDELGRLKAAKVTVIACQDFISRTVRIYMNDVEEVYGGPLIEPTKTPVYKEIRSANNLSLCFTSANYAPKKGFDEYLRLAQIFEDKPEVAFHVVGLQPEYRVIMPNVVYHNIMRPNELFKFYHDTIDIIVSPIKALEKNDQDGFPIGGEAMIQGCIPIHCDPYHANDFFGFTRREGLFIPIFDVQLVSDFVLDLLNDPSNMQQMSNATVNKMFQLYGPERQLVPIDKILKRVVAKARALPLLNCLIYDYDAEEFKNQSQYIIDLVINNNLKIILDVAVWRGYALIPIVVVSHLIGGKVIGFDTDMNNLIVAGDLPVELYEKFISYQQDACAEIKKDRTTLLGNLDTNCYAIYSAETHENIKWDETQGVELLYINCYHTDPCQELYNHLNHVKAGGFIIIHGIHLSHAKRALCLLDLFGIREVVNSDVWAVWKRNFKKAVYDTPEEFTHSTSYQLQPDKTFAIILPHIDPELNYLTSVLDSLSQQIYNQWVIYIVTQGATETTIQKLNELTSWVPQDKIYMINIAENRMISSWDLAIKRAKQNKHRYAVIFNPSEYCDKFFLWFLMNIYESYPGSAVVYTRSETDVHNEITFELKQINSLDFDLCTQNLVTSDKCSDFDLCTKNLVTSDKSSDFDKELIRDCTRSFRLDYMQAYGLECASQFPIISVPSTGIIQKKSFKYTISLCSIFKNEAKYLKEWIEYHLLIGVEHFYLFDNLSSDEPLLVLTPYIEKGIVTIHKYDLDYRYADFTNEHSEGWIHLKGPDFPYSIVIEKYKEESEFIGFIDLDEFIRIRSNVPIKHFLRKYQFYGGLAIHWLCIGSTNHYMEPEGLVLENYFLRPTKNHAYNIWVKSIINPRKFVAWQDVHLPVMTQPIVRSDFSVCNTRCHEQPLHDDISLYHYRTKSHEYYLLTKIARILPVNYDLRDMISVDKTVPYTGQQMTGNAKTIFTMFYNNRSEWNKCNGIEFNLIEDFGMADIASKLKRKLGLHDQKAFDRRIGRLPINTLKDENIQNYIKSQLGSSICYYTLLSEYWLIEGKCNNIDFHPIEEIVDITEFQTFQENPHKKDILTSYLRKMNPSLQETEEWIITDNMIYMYLVETNMVN